MPSSPRALHSRALRRALRADFKKNYLMTERGDPLSHENAAFFDSGLPGMDGYDSAMFVGTNVVWRREALDSIGGSRSGLWGERRRRRTIRGATTPGRRLSVQVVVVTPRHP